MVGLIIIAATTFAATVEATLILGVLTGVVEVLSTVVVAVITMRIIAAFGGIVLVTGDAVCPALPEWRR